MHVNLLVFHEVLAEVDLFVLFVLRLVGGFDRSEVNSLVIVLVADVIVLILFIRYVELADVGSGCGHLTKGFVDLQLSHNDLSDSILHSLVLLSGHGSNDES